MYMIRIKPRTMRLICVVLGIVLGIVLCIVRCIAYCHDTLDRTESFDMPDNTKLTIDTRITRLENIVNKLYSHDTNTKFLVHGWFVQFHNATHINTTYDTNNANIILTEMIQKIHGVPVLCSRTQGTVPYVGNPSKQIYFPRTNNIGFRAMTILKVPMTGYYDFKVLTDDGTRFFYQKVNADIIFNEKNIRSEWITAINSWQIQAENWVTSEKIYYNQNDLVLLRLDYFQAEGYASLCLKLRYYDGDQIKETDLPYAHTYCSLLWTEVPLLGIAN